MSESTEPSVIVTKRMLADWFTAMNRPEREDSLWEFLCNYDCEVDRPAEESFPIVSDDPEISAVGIIDELIKRRQFDTGQICRVVGFFKPSDKAIREYLGVDMISDA